MKKLTLVVMAAGMGSRYGGNKQIDGLGPNQEIIMDYSIYDAIQAGFNKVVFIIKKDMHETFHEVIGKRIASKVEIAYAYQDFDSLPAFYQMPSERTKPFGTVHAVLSAKELIREPFCVINADDYYGKEAFVTMHDYLSKLDNHQKDIAEFSMVGYRLQNTISENGHVTRGVCQANDQNELVRIVETYKITKFPDGTIRDINFHEEGDVLDPDALVSMNFWGFTPELFPLFEAYFEQFLKDLATTELKKEYGLPTAIADLMADGRIVLKILPCQSKWFGVTYQEDKPTVMQNLKELHDTNQYPDSLISWYR